MARPQPWLQPAVWVGGFSPLVVMGLGAAQGTLGANPVDRVLNRLGLLSLVFLLASLACTPLQRALGWAWPIRLRKTLGLMAFTYVTLHLLTYVALEQGFALEKLLEDVAKRPFITVGLAAWLLLVPLALTSTAGSVRRLGFERWKRLHRLAYVCAGLGVVHFVMRVKKDLTQPVAYGVVLGVLLLARLLPKRAQSR